jgi:predicted protein tyrosine phosphatase
MRKYFQSFYDLVEQEIQRTNILIHCLAGISRVQIFLMVVSNFSNFLYHEKKKSNF